jgi:hypothetical protein
MRVNGIVLGVVVGMVLLAGVAAPTTAQSGDDASSICPGTAGDSLVVVLPDGTAVQPGDSATLYAGTGGELVLCSGGEFDTNPTGSRWELNGDAIDGITVEGSSEYRYEITIANVDERVTIDFGADSAISGPSEVNTPDIEATAGTLDVVSVGGSGPYRISFADEDRLTRFQDANDTYVSTAGEMRTAAAEINADGAAVDRGRITELDQTTAFRDSYDTVQRSLFAAAAAGDADATAAMGAYADHREETVTAVQNDLRAANEKLGSRARNGATSLLLNVVGFLIVGAVVGGALGRYVTGKILGEVAHKRSRTSAVDFSPRQLAGQLGAAVLLLLAATGIGWYFGLVDALVAALRAVIGL